MESLKFIHVNRKKQKNSSIFYTVKESITKLLPWVDEESFVIDYNKKYIQNIFFKPIGLWMSPEYPLNDKSYTFLDYCIATHEFPDCKDIENSENLKSTNIPISLFCPFNNNKYPDKILIIEPRNLYDFSKYYYNVQQDIRFGVIDWKKISEEYSGIFFRPYPWFTLEEKMKEYENNNSLIRWYIDLDGESLCIWNYDLIRNLKFSKYKYIISDHQTNQ